MTSLRSSAPSSIARSTVCVRRRRCRCSKEQSLDEILQRVAGLILGAAVSAPAIALHRLIVAESSRFPKLAAVVTEQGGTDEAIALIAGVLERESRAGRLALDAPVFAAQQFLHMVISWPQRRAMGLGKPMTAAELDAWARDVVNLFPERLSRMAAVERDMPPRGRAGAFPAWRVHLDLDLVRGAIVDEMAPMPSACTTLSTVTRGRHDRLRRHPRASAGWRFRRWSRDTGSAS